MNSVTKNNSNPHALVRAQVINDVADNNLPDGTTRLDVIVFATRVPAVFPNNVDFSGNMTEAEASRRDDGDGVRAVANTPEVIHLRV